MAEAFDLKTVAVSIGLRTDRAIGEILTSENSAVGASKARSWPSLKAHRNFSYPSISRAADCPFGAGRESFSYENGASARAAKINAARAAAASQI